MNTIDEGLTALIARGFRFQHLTDQQGQLSIIVGFYGWPECWDRIEIHDEDDAAAARTTDASPEIDHVVWSYHGDTLSTIAAILALPQPHEPSAPRRSYRAPSNLWLPARSDYQLLP